MRVFVSAMLVSSSFLVLAESDWKRFAGLSGKSGWVCHVISPDPNDHGPDWYQFS